MDCATFPLSRRPQVIIEEKKLGFYGGELRFLRSFCGSVGMISFSGETKFSLADRGSAIGIKFVTKIYKLTCNVSEFVKTFINCERHCDHD